MARAGKFEHGDHANTVKFDNIDWNVEEATLDSAVFNNFVDGTQQIAVRLVLTRDMPRGTKHLDKNTRIEVRGG